MSVRSVSASRPPRKYSKRPSALNVKPVFSRSGVGRLISRPVFRSRTTMAACFAMSQVSVCISWLRFCAVSDAFSSAWDAARISS
jgi:hypothetical protein